MKIKFITFNFHNIKKKVSRNGSAAKFISSRKQIALGLFPPSMFI